MDTDEEELRVKSYAASSNLLSRTNMGTKFIRLQKCSVIHQKIGTTHGRRKEELSLEKEDPSAQPTSQLMQRQHFLFCLALQLLLFRRFPRLLEPLVRDLSQSAKRSSHFDSLFSLPVEYLVLFFRKRGNLQALLSFLGY